MKRQLKKYLHLLRDPVEERIFSVMNNKTLGTAQYF